MGPTEFEVTARLCLINGIGMDGLRSVTRHVIGVVGNASSSFRTKFSNSRRLSGSARRCQVQIFTVQVCSPKRRQYTKPNRRAEKMQEKRKKKKRQITPASLRFVGRDHLHLCSRLLSHSRSNNHGFPAKRGIDNFEDSGVKEVEG